MAAEALRRKDVAHPVTYPPGGGQIEFVVRGGTLIKQGARLAALAWAGEVRVVRAVVVRIQPRTVVGEQRLEPASHCRVRRFVEEPSRDAGLIGDNDRGPAGSVESSDGRAGAWEEPHRLGIGDIPGVFD